MNIYIYGNKGFKKEINNTLEHANIKFKLDENSKIKELEDLEELKEAVIANPNDIYLIDDEKIIKKDKISQKLKFLAPKDGIEEEFLLDNGIADLSVDSLKEIPSYILKKYEQMKLSRENEEIEESIIDIVDQAYNENDEPFELDDELKKLLSTDEMDNPEITSEVIDNSLVVTDSSMHEEENIEVDLDSFMDDEISKEEDSEKVLSKDELKDIVNFDEDVGLVNTDLDYDEKNTNEEANEDKVDKEEPLDEDMNEFENLMNNLDSSEEKQEDAKIEEDKDESFEQINEDKIESFIDEVSSEDNSEESKENDLEELMNELESSKENSDIDEDISKILDEIEDNNVELISSKEESLEGDIMSDEFGELDSLNENDVLDALKGIDGVNNTVQKKENNNAEMVLDSSNVNELSELITKLLNNKTLEITVKIKD